MKKKYKDIDPLELKQKKKPKLNEKFNPIRKNKKYLMQKCHEYI